MLGSKLSKAVIKHIENEHSGYVINIIVAGKNGNPDLIACIRGRFFAFEIKGKRDTKKRLQDEKLAQIAKAGGFGGYVYCIDDVDDIIKNLKRLQILTKKTEIKL